MYPWNANPPNVVSWLYSLHFCAHYGNRTVNVCPSASLYSMYRGKYEHQDIHLDKDCSSFVNSIPSLLLCNLGSCHVIEFMCFCWWCLYLMAVVMRSWPTLSSQDCNPYKYNFVRGIYKQGTKLLKAIWKQAFNSYFSVPGNPIFQYCFPWYREVSHSATSVLFCNYGYRCWEY